MRLILREVRRLREQASAMLPPPPEPQKEPQPEWFVRWVRALSAEIYAQAGWSRDCAETWESNLGTLHRIFNCAHHLFIRNLGREPTEKEWMAWLLISFEVAQPPDTDEARDLQWLWLMLHLLKWKEEREGVARGWSDFGRQVLEEKPTCTISELIMSDAAGGQEEEQETPCVH